MKVTLKCHSLLSSYRRVTCERGKNWDRGLYCWKEAKELCTKQLRQIGFSVRVTTFPLSSKLVNGHALALSQVFGISILCSTYLSSYQIPIILNFKKKQTPFFFFFFFAFFYPHKNLKPFLPTFPNVFIFIFICKAWIQRQEIWWVWS